MQTLMDKGRMRRRKGSDVAGTHATNILDSYEKVKDAEERVKLYEVEDNKSDSAFDAIMAKVAAEDLALQAQAANLVVNPAAAPIALANTGLAAKEQGSFGRLRGEVAAAKGRVDGHRARISDKALRRRVAPDDIRKINQHVTEASLDIINADAAYDEVVEYNQEIEKVLVELQSNEVKIQAYINSLRIVGTPEAVSSSIRANARLVAVRSAKVEAQSVKTDLVAKLDEVRRSVKDVSSVADTQAFVATGSVVDLIIQSATAGYASASAAGMARDAAIAAITAQIVTDAVNNGAAAGAGAGAGAAAHPLNAAITMDPAIQAIAAGIWGSGAPQNHFTELAAAIFDRRSPDEIARVAKKSFPAPDVFDILAREVQAVFTTITPAPTDDAAKVAAINQVMDRILALATTAGNNISQLINATPGLLAAFNTTNTLPPIDRREMFRAIATAVVLGKDDAAKLRAAQESFSGQNALVFKLSYAQAQASAVAVATAAAAAAIPNPSNTAMFEAAKTVHEVRKTAAAAKDIASNAKEELQKIRDLHDRVAFNDTPDITTVGDFISTLGKDKRVADARTDLVRKFQVEMQGRQAAAGAGGVATRYDASGKFIGGGEISVSLDKGDFTIKFQGMARSTDLQQLQDGNTSPCSWPAGNYYLVSFEIKTKDGEVVKFPLLVPGGVEGQSLNIAGARLFPDLSITSYGKDTRRDFSDPISGSTYQTDSAAKTAAVQVGDAASGRVTSSGLGMRAERSRAGTAAAGHNREPLCDILDSTLRKVGGASLQKVSDTQYRVQPAMSLDRDDKIKVRFSSRDTLKTTQKRKLEDLMEYLDKNEGEERKFTITLKKRTFKPGEPKTVEIEFYKKGEELVIKDKSSSAKDEGYKIFFKKNSSGSAYEYSTHNATKEESPLFGFVRASQKISVEIAKRDLYRYQQKAGRPHDPTVIVVKKNYETKPPVDKNFFTLSDIPAANSLSGETPPPYTSLRKERQHGPSKEVTKLVDYQLVIDDYKKAVTQGAGR